MALLIKNARVFVPNDIGRQNVLMVGEQIAAIGPDLTCDLPDLETIDASALGLADQGVVAKGACLFTEDFTLTDVVARGRVMMREGEVVVKGTFEE